MSRWFRVYDDMVDDPKVQRLGPDLFKALVNLWCLASQNDGRLPCIDDIAYKLRVNTEIAEKIIAELVRCGLLDHCEQGLIPHNWNKRQYKSDVTDPTAATRMKRYRKGRNAVTGRKRNGTVTVTPTRAEQNRTDQNKKIGTEEFEEFKKVYPKRKGGNPWKSASAVFSKLVDDGADPKEIIGAAKDGIGFDRDKIGTEFIPQAVKWLRDERFRDRPSPPSMLAVAGVYVPADTPQMDAWLLHERASGKRYPRDKNGGWHFPSEFPPTPEKSEAA